MLNWGGSLGAALHGTGLVQLLLAVYQATPALLDRWDVRVQPTVRRSGRLRAPRTLEGHEVPGLRQPRVEP